MEGNKLKPDVVTYTIVIEGLCNAGEVQSAKDLFCGLSPKGVQPNVRTYTIMISGLCKGGLLVEAEEMLREMEQKGVMTVLLLMAFRFCSIFQNAGEDRTDFQGREASPVRTPLLLPKDDDGLSWGSSYECTSNDEEDFEEFLGVSSLEGKSINGGNDNNTLRLCVICFDGPRDCFFLPCGHCATCFTCGTRIYEEAGTCPICLRKMKKVRKIFSV